MSILSDKTIKLLCAPVQYELVGADWHLMSPEEAHAVMVKRYKDIPTGFRLKGAQGQQIDIGSPGLPTLKDFIEAKDGTQFHIEIAHSRTSMILRARRQTPMISPFITESVRRLQHEGKHEFPILSSGTSSYGYDVTLTEEFQIFSNANGGVVDPKRFDQENCLIDGQLKEDPATGEKWVILPPNSYLLGVTREHFVIPRDVCVVAVGKSTYARAGAIVNVTPIEAGFEGTVVIEISNATTLPLRIYANEGVAQFLFFRGDQPCEVSYADRKGKYQNQQGLVHSKV